MHEHTHTHTHTHTEWWLIWEGFESKPFPFKFKDNKLKIWSVNTDLHLEFLKNKIKWKWVLLMHQVGRKWTTENRKLSTLKVSSVWNVIKIVNSVYNMIKGSYQEFVCFKVWILATCYFQPSILYYLMQKIENSIFTWFF